MSVPSSGGPPRGRGPWPAGGLALLHQREWLLILCVVVFLMSIGLGIATPVLPIYGETFGVSTALVGFLWSGLGMAGVAALFGLLARETRPGARPRPLPQAPGGGS